MEKRKYFVINGLRLARALSYLGFEYMVFKKEEYDIYSFENTDEFQEAYRLLVNSRKKYNKNIRK